MKSLTLRQKIGQLMMFGFKGMTPSESIKEMIKKHHVGGVILFSRNVGTAEEVLSLNNQLQEIAQNAGHEYPLLISIDQENGVVRRLGVGTTLFPGNMALGAVNSEKVTCEVSKGTATELKELGINMNLAPVVDVNNNPENPVIGVRSYGEDPETVGRMGVAAIRGHQAAGVVTTIKHFPGHGDTNVDSHLALPTIAHDRKRLDEVELVPFKRAIEAGADCVMIAHVYFPAIETGENVPATVSPTVIRGLLREELGFDGVVTTDCMEMKAIQDTFGTAEGALLGLKAGIDMIMISHSYELQLETIERIVKAVEEGEISESLIDEAAERILRLKNKYLDWNGTFRESVSEVVNGPEHKKISEEAYHQSVTVLQNRNQILPFQPSSEDDILVVYPNSKIYTLVEDTRYATYALGEAVKKLHQNVTELSIDAKLTDEDLEKIVQKAKQAEYIIVGTLNAHLIPEQQELVKRFHQLDKPMVVIAMRSPYDLLAFPEVNAYLTTYEYTLPALQTAVEIVFGRRKAYGKLPITLPGLYERGYGINPTK
jgi:beta-N-acetylhexosaminidase